MGQERALKATAHGHLALIEQAIAGVEQETKPRLRYARYAHLSWRLELYGRATPEFGLPRRTSMRLPPHLSWIGGPERLWWISGAGGYLKRRTAA